MGLNFKGRVAIVTGAGGGLGRQHALALAARGAHVLVNDVGGGVHGGVGADAQVGPAQRVVDEIRAQGGEAIASTASVTDFAAVQAMVKQAVDAWGRVDILVNNAGILRDKSFAKMELADFRLVLDVHLMGAVHCSKAVWPLMVEQKHGRIVMTTSSSGLYGNFGQANYGAAKMALVGLMQTLAIEGEKHNIKVNCLAPTAMTRMTEDLFPPDMREAFGPEAVVPAMLVLASDQDDRTVVIPGLTRDPHFPAPPASRRQTPRTPAAVHQAPSAAAPTDAASPAPSARHREPATGRAPLSPPLRAPAASGRRSRPAPPVRPAAPARSPARATARTPRPPAGQASCGSGGDRATRT